MVSRVSAGEAHAASSSSALHTSVDSTYRPTATTLQHTSAESQDLWSTILNSVKSSKAISARNLVLLGEPKSGKTTLLSALASTSPLGLISGKSSETGLDPSNAASTSRASLASHDLGLAYAYFDVGDEKDKDEIVARVGAYTLHSSEPAYTSLLPYAFPEPNLSSSEKDASSVMAALAAATISGTRSASTTSSNRAIASKPSMESLKDSIVVILLDWEQPWTFLEQLRNWLAILRELVDDAAQDALSSQQQQLDARWSKTRALLVEMKDRLDAYIRAYVEPTQKSTESGSAAAAQVDAPTATQQTTASVNSDNLTAPITNVSVILDGADSNPLAEGTLTDNIGIPIVVVCTKADAIPRLERDKQFKEEQFDYIQQVLRTICMKYGAALFYTSSVRTQSIDILRSYLLHRLFTPSIASSQQPQQQSSGATAHNSAAAGGVASFGFPYRASTTDRDTLLVPAGWDSWGKIKALRETFDSRSMARGWDNDCEIERLRRSRGLARTKEVEDQLEKEVLAQQRGDGALEGDEVQSAMKLYEDIVADWEAAPTGKDTANKLRIPDEQSFLGQHHATLQKDPDPRSKFSKRGVVGPMTGSSAGLPSVEKYMAREGKESASATASGQTDSVPTPTRPRLETSNSSSKRESTSAAAAAAVAAMTGASDRSSRPSSPAVNSGTTSPGAPKQSEVLHSFFQSLLKDKGSGSPKVDRLRTTSAAPGRRDPPASANK